MTEDDGAPAAVVWSFGAPSPIRVASPEPGAAVFPADPDPTGARSAFVTAVDGPGGHEEALWVSAGDGPLRQLARAQMVRNPEWTADGAALVFESDRESYRDLFLVRADASLPPTRLTDAENGSFEPAISFDGSTLAMGTSRDRNAEIWLARADGTDQHRFTDHPADDVHPVWLIDGRLSWLSYREGRPRVWIRDMDAHDHPLRVDPAESIDLDMAWSSTGVGAVVVQTSPETIELQLFRADGTPVAVVDGPGPDEHPAWSPDGRWLAFTSSRGGSAQVWLVDAEGGGARQLSQCAKACWLPRWSRATP